MLEKIKVMVYKTHYLPILTHGLRCK